MKILGYNIAKQTEAKPVEMEKVLSPLGDFRDLPWFPQSNTDTDTPVIFEKKNSEWVWYGEDNLYPNTLLDLYRSSTMHSAIINRTAMMAAGKSIQYDDSKMTEEQKTQFTEFLKHPDGKNSLQDIIEQLTVDYKIYGAFSLEYIWSLDFTSITKFRKVDVGNLRSGKLNNGEVEKYGISRDWANKKCPVKTIHAFSTKDKTHFNQLKYVANPSPGMEYYASPDYASAINWISLSADVPVFYRAFMENGFNPSMIISIIQPNNLTNEKKEEFKSNVKRAYGGKKKAGEPFITVSPSRDMETTVKPVETSALDRQWTVLQEAMAREILTAHSVSCPMLFGLVTPGSLSSNNELITGQQIFQNTVVSPIQRKIEKVINEIIEINGWPTAIRIEPINVLL